MTPGPTIDGVLVQWGERLFYPASRIVKPAPTPRLDTMTRRKAAVIRQRIEATVMRWAPQVWSKGHGRRAWHDAAWRLVRRGRCVSLGQTRPVTLTNRLLGVAAGSSRSDERSPDVAVQW